MTEYEVVQAGGIELNGDLYPQGTTFEFDVLPGHIAAAIEAGAIAEKVAAESPKASEESSASSSESNEAAPESAVVAEPAEESQDGSEAAG